ncbi:MAG: TonB-dependent receptor [Myxococcota bacterium]
MLLTLVAALAADGTLSGQVVDTDGIPVPAAEVALDGPGPSARIQVGADGRFSLSLPEGDWDLRVSRPGFVSATYPVHVDPGGSLQTAFVLAPLHVEQIVVQAENRPWRDVERGVRQADPSTVTGLYELTRRDLESTPGSLEDITRAAHALPGVVSDGDLFAGFHVRGGEQQDVVFLLDRVPLENPFHLAGFNSLFNPDMVRSVRFFAGAAPADVPSATSAVVDVASWDGTRACADDDPMCGGLDGSVDLSASSARGFLTGPLDRRERWTFALAARRTYMEGYFAVLKAANVLDRAFVAPEFSELSGRLAFHPGSRHRFLLSAVQAGDRLGLIDSEDDSAIDFDGAFELRTSLGLVSLDHRYRSPGLTVQTTAAYTRDRAFSNRELERDTLQRTTRLQRLFLRSDAIVPFGPDATLKLGADASRFAVDSTGSIQDQRAFPRWTQAGIGAFGFQVADVTNDPDPWAEANAYVQTEVGAAFGKPPPGGLIVPGIKARAGLRVTYSGLAGDVLASPRAGLSLPLPSGTVPKVSVGLYQRVLRDPFQLAPGYGNPDLTAERARHVVVGVDQGFPLPGTGRGGLVRVEVYDIALTDLVVNPDTEAAVQAGLPFQNVGSGHSRGLDVMVAARGGRANAELVYGLLDTRRTNPLNTVFPQDLAPPQDQRHTFSVAGDYAPVERWRFTGRYTFHSGRPLSEVGLLSAEWESIQLTCLNCARIGPTHSIDVRAEWRKAFEHYRLTFYAEVLNVGNIPSRFLPIHDVIDGEVTTSWLNHLPMRPFLGLRADF